MYENLFFFYKKFLMLILLAVAPYTILYIQTNLCSGIHKQLDSKLRGCCY